jgi:hypothetical protein
MNRHETADGLADLMVKFGWVDNPLESRENKETARLILEVKNRKGVTMLSHSK